jgi:5-methylcytosine-specific restriction endonuclease McrA
MSTRTDLREFSLEELEAQLRPGSAAHHGVLVLDQSWRPCTIVSRERAITLIVMEEAQAVEDVPGEFFHSPSTRIPVPSVLVMTRPPAKGKMSVYKPVPLSRRALFARDGWVCAYGCGRKADTIDHVIPRSRGGKNTWANVAACCSVCNAYKADRTPEEAGLVLGVDLIVPSRVAMLASRGRHEWLSYLT